MSCEKCRSFCIGHNMFNTILTHSGIKMSTKLLKCELSIAHIIAYIKFKMWPLDIFFQTCLPDNMTNIRNTIQQNKPWLFPTMPWNTWTKQQLISTYTEWIDGLVQERQNSIANALELRLSCTNPSKYTLARKSVQCDILVITCCNSGCNDVG